MSGSRHSPADDAAGEDVDHEGHVDEAGPGRHIGEVGNRRVRSCLPLLRRPTRHRRALPLRRDPTDAPDRLPDRHVMTAAAGMITIFGKAFAGSPSRHGSARAPNVDPSLQARSGAISQSLGEACTRFRHAVGPLPAALGAASERSSRAEGPREIPIARARSRRSLTHPAISLYGAFPSIHFFIGSPLPDQEAVALLTDLGRAGDVRELRGVRVEFASGRDTSRHNLVFGGSKTRTMMQLCASAAKLRDDRPILPCGTTAKETRRDPATSNWHPQS